MASDAQYKQFLGTHAAWATTYVPIIHKVCDEIRQKGKPVPSLALILSVINQESAGSAWATRHEPGFEKWLRGRIQQEPSILKTYGPCSRDTEIVLRSTSFGPMQVMGQVYRELGFTGTYLTEGCNPQVGLAYGIKYLARLLDKYKDEDAACAAFNAGSPRKTASGKYHNQEYVDGVRRFKTNWDYIVSKEWI